MRFDPISFGIGYFFGAVTVVILGAACLLAIAWEWNKEDDGDSDES